MTMVNKVVPWIETFWFAQKRFPSDTELVTVFNFGGQPLNSAGSKVEFDLLQKLKLTKQFKLALNARGITYNPFSESGSQDFSKLSPAQVATISLLTNFSDTRPTPLKLRSINVTTEEIQGWMVNPEFNRLLTARADEQLNNIYPEAVTALNRRIKNGSVPAIKFYFELTGRATTPETLNLKLAMQHLIEAVQKHVHDPLVLEAIARDFQAVQALSSSQQEGVGQMGSTTSKFTLYKPDPSEDVDVNLHLNANWDKLADANTGAATKPQLDSVQSSLQSSITANTNSIAALNTAVFGSTNTKVYACKIRRNDNAQTILDGAAPTVVFQQVAWENYTGMSLVGQNAIKILLNGLYLCLFQWTMEGSPGGIVRGRILANSTNVIALGKSHGSPGTGAAGTDTGGLASCVSNLSADDMLTCDFLNATGAPIHLTNTGAGTSLTVIWVGKLT